ncbi:MAG: 4Fe-4S ferredoxin, partial [Spirochaetota bacterium]
AHLDHLAHHGQDVYIREAIAWLEAKGLPLPEAAKPIVDSRRRPAAGTVTTATPAPASVTVPQYEACPGSAARRFTPVASAGTVTAKAGTTSSAARAETDQSSALSSWPIQLQLVNPRSPQFADADILVAADCTAFSLGGFHAKVLEGKSLVIACPKLDQGREIYVDKLATIMANARSVTVAIMEVPCCSGLQKIVLEARDAGVRKPRVNTLVLGIQGGIVKEYVS